MDVGLAGGHHTHVGYQHHLPGDDLRRSALRGHGDGCRTLVHPNQFPCSQENCSAISDEHRPS